MRAQIKQRLLERQKNAEKYALQVCQNPGLSQEEVENYVHKYVCCKFFLNHETDQEIHILEMVQRSMKRAEELQILAEKESEKGVSCGAAGTEALKVALLFRAIQKDFQVTLSPQEFGLIKSTRDIGKMIFDARSKL